MWRKLLGVVLGLIGMFGLLVISAAIDDFAGGTTEPAAIVIGLVICVTVTALCLIGSYLLFRSARRRPEPVLGWTPADEQWLHPRWWSELPDPFPASPRRRTTALPAVAVPPDELLRKLWLVRAELVRDRASPWAVLPPLAWIATVAFLPLLVFFIAGITVTVGSIRNDTVNGAEWVLLELTGIPLVAMIMAFVRPIRRHFGLVRLEGQLTMRDRLRPGGPRGGLRPVGRRGAATITDPQTGYSGNYHPSLR